jgi:hypothetical protein
LPLNALPLIHPDLMRHIFNFHSIMMFPIKSH